MSATSKPELVKEVLPRVEGVDRRAIPRDHSITPQMELDFFIAQANEARRNYEDAKAEFRAFQHEEAKLEAERPVKLAEIKIKYMDGSRGTLAATPAEHQAKCDSEYLNHLALQRDVVRFKDDALTRAISAQMRQDTAVAAFKAIAGLI